MWIGWHSNCVSLETSCFGDSIAYDTMNGSQKMPHKVRPRQQENGEWLCPPMHIIPRSAVEDRRQRDYLRSEPNNINWRERLTTRIAQLSDRIRSYLGQ